MATQFHIVADDSTGEEILHALAPILDDRRSGIQLFRMEPVEDRHAVLIEIVGSDGQMAHSEHWEKG